MTDTTDSTHPLDDDDAEFGKADPGGVTPVYGPLQKLGIYLLLAAGVLVVMTGIVAAEAADGSTLANTAFGLNRLFTVLLLVGFVTLLVSYQIPRIKVWLEAGRERRSQQSADAYDPLQHSVSSQQIAGRELRLLSLLSGGAIFVSWLTLLSPSFLAPLTALLHVGCIFFSFGLSITVAVWHEGVLRAFGIGVAAAIFLSPFLFGALLVSAQWWITGGMLFSLPLLPILDTLILLSGLLCAGYVRVWMAYREGRSADGRA